VINTAALPQSSSPRPADVGQVGTILDAAEVCFAKSGYAAASMREIAEHAGVSKSLLHYHFKSKEHLFVETQMRAYQRLAARVAEVAAPVAGGKERGLAAFDALIAALRQTGELRVQAELWAGGLSNPRLREHVVRLREFFRGLIVKTVGDLVGAELGAAGITVEEAGDLVWATLNGIGLEAAFGSAAERVDGAVLALRHLAAIALGAPTARARLTRFPATPRRTKRR
jgi:AcrR family transcriptional regulator